MDWFAILFFNSILRFGILDLKKLNCVKVFKAINKFNRAKK